MRRRRLDGGENSAENAEGSQAVLAGMRHIAGEKDAIMRRRIDEAAAQAEEDKQIAAKRWKDALTKPNLDYSEIFDEVGSSCFSHQLSHLQVGRSSSRCMAGVQFPP